MTEEEREDLIGLDTSTDAPDAEDAGEELMAAALDAGLQAEDESELDPEAQFGDESVKVGRGADGDGDDEEHVPPDGSLMSV